MIKQIKKSIRQTFKPSLAAMIGTDALFFFSWGLLLTPFMNQIIKTAIEISKEINTITAAMSHELFGQLLTYMGLTYLLGFILYIIFHGTAWWIAKKMAKKQEKYFRHLWRFFKVNIIWGVLIAANSMLTIYFNMQHRMYTAAGAESWNIPGIILNVLLWITVFLAFLSYPKTSVKEAFTKIPSKAPTVLVCFILFQIATLIPQPIYAANEMLAHAIGFVLIFPTLAWIRIYAVNTL